MICLFTSVALPWLGAMRDQEVLRATRELAAYFKGLRTEREARAALKIIKGFIKHRERSDAARRRPLPGLEAAPAPKQVATRKRKKAGESGRKPRSHDRQRAVNDRVETDASLDTNDQGGTEDSVARE